ncbi:class I SAM-dependent methyltransferase [Oricola thermophila]|uniref:Class I SAM-dependent methyltransferase n=1 Tax=Oricola thermophila TaxID=2742145 RepID=A0A6N1VH38_9HYPH|nr:class I SAM-dependent methyltransferase [Oricola thermophila]QKV20134.1 class I SAM-dependent methyltransferase [Oricola thermophila]
MYMDIVEIRGFYHSLLGKMATRSIGMGLTRIWQPMPNERLLGLGYARPWLERFEPDTERTLSFMLAAQGAVKWPRTGPSRSALVFDEELPLPDAAIDRILMVHALEHAENPRETLMEAWRVLAPNGRLVLVVPNRRGLWARFEHTPFGTGRPFSRGQITKLLRDANFTPGPMTEALAFPPVRSPSLLRIAYHTERIGLRMWPVFSGVLIIEAQKRLFQGLPVAERQSRRVFVPVLAPQGAALGSDRF